MPLILTVTKSPEGYSHVSRVNGVDDGTPTSDRARGGPLEAPSDGQVWSRDRAAAHRSQGRLAVHGFSSRTTVPPEGIIVSFDGLLARRPSSRQALPEASAARR